MDGTFKTLIQNQLEAMKSPIKMEFFTEPQSQCRTCDFGWFKTSERLWKIHWKWNSTLNRDFNFRTCDYGWQLIQNKWEAMKNQFKMEFYTEPRSQF